MKRIVYGVYLYSFVSRDDKCGRPDQSQRRLRQDRLVRLRLPATGHCGNVARRHRGRLYGVLSVVKSESVSLDVLFN